MGQQRADLLVLAKATTSQARNGWDDPVKATGSVEICSDDGPSGGSGNFPQQLLNEWHSQTFTPWNSSVLFLAHPV
jgi:hypothetical protein